MTAKEFLLSKGRREIEGINGYTNEYLITPKEMEEFARLQSQPVTDCNGFSEEVAELIAHKAWVQSIRKNSEPLIEKGFKTWFSDFKSQHPELFQPKQKVVDWNDLTKRYQDFCLRKNINAVNFSYLYLFGWLKEQPEFTTAPAEKGGKP